MATPRYYVVKNWQRKKYHCWNKCVRGAYLCGRDKSSGKDYSHRREWIKDRLKLLTKVFTIDVLSYAIMENHYHIAIESRPDLVVQMSDREVVYRWLLLHPLRNDEKMIDENVLIEPTEEEIKKVLKDGDRVKQLRERLQSVSWFMGSLNEFIAVKSNREDGCKGRFWDGRFKCRNLDESYAAILACCIYIDLNPIRASMAQTPEESEYTSVYERIKELKIREKIKRIRGKTRKRNELAKLKKELKEFEWLAPLEDSGERIGFLNITIYEYLEILDATGRELKKGKSGKIPSHLEPILQRLNINPDMWLKTIDEFNDKFYLCVGNIKSFKELAETMKRKWLKGIALARKAFICASKEHENG